MTSTSKRALLGILVAGALRCAPIVAAQVTVDPATASISGTMMDTAGLPVAGAIVEYHNFRTFVRDSLGRLRNAGPIIAATVRTDAAGLFTIRGLPAARYGVCAYAVLAAQLGSCEWDAPGALINVTAAESVTGLRLRLSTGALINVQVADPNGRVAAGARFAVGVISPNGAYKRAKLLLSTASALSYQVAVPLGATMYLVLDSTLSVLDQDGQPVVTRTRGPQVSLGTSAETTVILQVQ